MKQQRKIILPIVVKPHPYRNALYLLTSPFESKECAVILHKTADTGLYMWDLLYIQYQSH